MGPFRTDAPRLTREPLSFSGGGVGGKTLRFVGGSDCCLLLWRLGLTRLVAAKEILSAGRSSLPSDFPAFGNGLVFHLDSEDGGSRRGPWPATYILDLRARKAGESVGTV